MQRYFFHVCDGPEKTHIDTVGEVLADDDAAWKEAVSSAGLTLRDFSATLKAGTEWRMEVVDEVGDRLFVIRIQTSREKPA